MTPTGTSSATEGEIAEVACSLHVQLVGGDSVQDAVSRTNGLLAFAHANAHWAGRPPYLLTGDSAAVPVVLRRVDWAALRRQKETLDGVVLVSCWPLSADEVGDLRALLHLLDHIQDEAAKVLGEEAVFGEAADAAS